MIHLAVPTFHCVGLSASAAFSTSILSYRNSVEDSGGGGAIPGALPGVSGGLVGFPVPQRLAQAVSGAAQAAGCIMLRE